MGKIIFIYCILLISCNYLFAGDIETLIQKYSDLAEQNNSKLQSQYMHWQAQNKNIDAVTKLPNPRLSFGHFMKNIETAVGPQEYKIGLYQNLPWFGKLNTEKKIQIYRTEIEKIKLKKSMELIEFQISELLYDINFVNQKLKILDTNLSLIRQWLSILEIKYQSSSHSYADIIKVQQEIYLLEEQTSAINKQKQKLVLSLESVTESKIDEEVLKNIMVSFEILEINCDSLVSQTKKSNSDLQIIHLKKEIAELIHHRASQDLIPNAGVGFDYILTGDKYQSNGSKVKDSGKNPLVLMVSLEIPLQFRKISKNIESKKIQALSVDEMEKESEKNILMELEKLIIDIDDIQSNYTLYVDKIIPSTRQSLKIRSAELESGKVDIYRLIENQRELLKYQLELAGIEKDYFITTAKISRLTGSKK